MIWGILCLVYAILVYFVAIKKPPKLLNLVKKKLGNKTTDRTAVIVCYVVATMVLAGAIVLFVFVA